MSLPPPNYTQVPNILFDQALWQIETVAELKVTLVIIRQTFGWHKKEDNLSLSRLVGLTGLSKQSVIAGITSALRLGLVTRRKKGQSYLYRLNVKLVDEPNVSRGTSQESRLALVQSLDQQLVKNLDTQKKEEKEKRKERAAPPPPQVQLFREITERYPKKVLYPDIVEMMGEQPDPSRARAAYKAWVSRGYNAYATTWLEWYRDGIPQHVTYKSQAELNRGGRGNGVVI